MIKKMMTNKLAIVIGSIVMSVTGYAEGGKAQVTAYPLPAIYNPSTVFSLEAGGVPVPVVNYTDKYDYACFSMSAGTVELTIELLGNAAVTAYYISPRKLNIAAKPSGNRLRFTLSKDAYLIVKINGL